MATADIFDALSAARPYRGAMPLEQVLTIIGEERGTQLCPATVDALFAVAARNGGGSATRDPPYVRTVGT